MEKILIEALQWRDAAVDLLFPPGCMGCPVIPEDRSLPLCLSCQEKLPRVGTFSCRRCCQSYEGESAADFACANCGELDYSFESFATIYLAKGLVREAIHDLKYRERTGMIPLLTHWLSEALADERLASRKFDLVVPVPLFPRKERERGFNQSALLAKALAAKIGVPYRAVLRRIRDTSTQTQLDRNRRIENLRDAIVLDKVQSVSNLNILLVDDVFTTGATLNECSHVLCRADAASVCVVTVARG